MSDRTKNANFKDNAETGDVAYVVAPSQIDENPALSAGFSFSLAFGIRQRAHACGTIAIEKEYCPSETCGTGLYNSGICLK